MRSAIPLLRYFPAPYIGGWVRRLLYWAPAQARDALGFYRRTIGIYEDREQQTAETVAALKKKYAQQLAIGRLPVTELLKMLGECYDPSSVALGGVSQLGHSLQVAEGMERDGIRDPDLLIAALVHDLGKLLLLAGERPENVVGMRRLIGEFPHGAGWDNCLFNWGHDDFIYLRLKNYLPDHVAWLLRHHSLMYNDMKPYMDDRDRRYYDRYMRVFQQYDDKTKSMVKAPVKRIADYQALIDSYFPEPVAF